MAVVIDHTSYISTTEGHEMFYTVRLVERSTGEYFAKVWHSMTAGEVASMVELYQTPMVRVVAVAQ